MTINQFIFGSFEGIDGGHQVVASSPGISPQIIKDLNQIQSRYIGDYQGSSPEMIHYIWASTKLGRKVFAGFNFSGEDSHGRQGIIRMHGLVIEEENIKEIDYNPFVFIHLIRLIDLENRAKMGLDLIEVLPPFLETVSDTTQNRNVLNYLIEKIKGGDKTIFPFLEESDKAILQQLFNLLTPLERKETTFVTYSNFSNKLTLTGTDEPLRSTISSYEGDDFVDKRIRLTVFDQKASLSEPRINGPRAEESPIPVKESNKGVGIKGLLVGVFGLIGLLMILLRFNLNTSDGAESVSIIDSIEATSSNADRLIDGTMSPNLSDRKYINQKAKPIKMVNLRESPSENAKSLAKLTAIDTLDCIYCLTQIDTVQYGCSSTGSLNEGNWCSVRVLKTKIEGWVWKPCITIQ